MKPGNHLLLLVFPLFFPFAVCAQQDNADHVSKKQIKQMNAQYEQLQNDVKALEQQRIQLEVALKNYDTKLKDLTQSLGKTEQQYDHALPQSAPEQLLAATRQAEATQMSYNIQFMQVENQLQNQNRQFEIITGMLKTKLDAIKKRR